MTKILFTLVLLLAGCKSEKTAPDPPSAQESPKEDQQPFGGTSPTGASFTTGLAETTVSGLVDCGGRSRPSAVGKIRSDDGTEWIVPAATNFATAAKAPDLFNQCGGVELSSSSSINVASIPIVDAGGDEEFVAYIFADNYFELYVNGTLVGVDPIPFTPFNSNIVRFKATLPVALAIMMVDWEENLGLGSEKNRGKAFHPGDGGLVAVFKDAKGATVSVTDESWRAQTFYTAPLSSRKCLQQRGNTRDSSACSDEGGDDASGLSAAHWPIPKSWMKPTFDDSTWPQAVTFSNETVGVNNKKAYTNFSDIFDDKSADAKFIWSSNLVLDNVVLLRKTLSVSK